MNKRHINSDSQYSSDELIRAFQQWISQLKAHNTWHPYKFRECCLHGSRWTGDPAKYDARIVNAEEVPAKPDAREAERRQIREWLREQDELWREQQKQDEDKRYGVM